jgi:hypothetical protein
MRRNNRTGHLLVLVGWWLFSACHPGEVGKRKLISLIEHDGKLNQAQEINNIKVWVKYIPYQLMVLQEIDNSKPSDTVKLKELERKYGGQYYFRLSFSKNNRELTQQFGSIERYSDMVQTLSFGLAKFINASTERRDTVLLSDYAFEQDYGMSAANSVLLVFKKDEISKAGRITVNIGEFGFGTGNLRFAFSQDDLKSLPKLDYYQD